MTPASDNNNQGFTLIELLVVISIIAVIMAASMVNLLGARQRARDIKLKEEATAFKSALRLYYNDYNLYPGSNGLLYQTINACGALGTAVCPCSASLDFAAGGALCDNVYMKKFPSVFGVSKTMKYYQVNSGDGFRIVVQLENGGDPDIAASELRCPIPSQVPVVQMPTVYDKTKEFVVCED